LGARVTGSELVGLIPKDAMLMAGRHYMKQAGTSTAVSERELIRIAVMSMGLDELSEFNIEKKIIEYNFKSTVGLTRMKVDAFTDELASDSPAPGGGSVAALAGALSASLSAMVTNLTFNKKGYEDKNELMEKTGVEGQQLKDWFLNAVNSDTEAFNAVMAAMRLPKKSDDEKAARLQAIDAANKNATLVPLSVLENTIPAFRLASAVAENGNQNSLSDSGVAGLTARCAAHGAYYNVLINLAGIEDKGWAKNIREQADKFLAEADKLAEEIEKIVLNAF
jgi:glutamate formiminotransferase/formiminotetrahydrofolate cyclodeaminase